MTLMINVGKWGGFYVLTGSAFRVCIGWIAFTILPYDMDFKLNAIIDKIHRYENAKKEGVE